MGTQLKRVFPQAYHAGIRVLKTSEGDVQSSILLQDLSKVDGTMLKRMRPRADLLIRVQG